MGLAPPSRYKVFSWSTRSSLAWEASGILEISSRKSVPGVRLLDLSHGLLIRAGERPPLVPEQLALKQRLGNRAAIHGDEWVPRASTGLVNSPRHHLLSRAGFAHDEHAEIRFRHPFNGGDHSADRLTGAEGLARREDMVDVIRQVL